VGWGGGSGREWESTNRRTRPGKQKQLKIQISSST
jgi:hypothetical protein